MNTLDIANAITDKDIENARQLLFKYKSDIKLDGLRNDIDKVCKEKGLTANMADTVFALTYARLNK